MNKEPNGNEGRSQLVEAFHENEEALRHYVLRRLAVKEEAQDIVQEIFVRLMRLEGDKVVTNHRSYLFEMAHNLTIDRIRKVAREKVNFNSDYLASLEQLIDDISPEQITHYRQRFAMLMSVLEKMPERWRKALIMHRWENKTYAEIAEQLGVTTHAVKKYLTKAVVFCQVRMGKPD